jgi:anti-sigma B factor antagonist
VDLAIIEDASQGRTIVKLCGELDIASAPGLRERLLAILSRRAPSHLILDLSKLQFIDSSGIAAFVNTERRARLLGCTVVLVAPQAPVSRVLQICGLDQHFAIFENISALTGDGLPDFSRTLRLGLEPEAGEADPAARPAEQV